MSKVAIIGYGNVGYHLAKRLETKNEVIIYSRTPDGTATQDLKDLDAEEFNFIILAIPDAAIAEVSSSIETSNAIVVHTSGSRPITDVANHTKHGVLYPLQTFSRRKEIDFASFPIFIEGNDEAEREIFSFVRSFSNDVRLTTSTNRAKLHLAAVFACNFTNHMYQTAEKLLEPLDMTFQDLQHLTEETLHKALELNPSKAQTGPAKRGDDSTLQLHLNMISDDRLKKIYELISEDIRNA
jgi:predicted short-subunit dehydrogenase-like oxidoreductase (DUF2520 family)